jgi:hypothetical protein
MLNDFLTQKLFLSNLTGVVNTVLFTNFLKSKASHIQSHIPIPINKMGLLNVNTVILLKLV